MSPDPSSGARTETVGLDRGSALTPQLQPRHGCLPQQALLWGHLIASAAGQGDRDHRLLRPTVLWDNGSASFLAG